MTFSFKFPAVKWGSSFHVLAPSADVWQKEVFDYRILLFPSGSNQNQEISPMSKTR